MPDEPDPPRKFYEFKPREFETVNPPTGAVQAIPAGLSLKMGSQIGL